MLLLRGLFGQTKVDVTQRVRELEAREGLPFGKLPLGNTICKYFFVTALGRFWGGKEFFDRKVSLYKKSIDVSVSSQSIEESY